MNRDRVLAVLFWVVVVVYVIGSYVYVEGIYRDGIREDYNTKREGVYGLGDMVAFEPYNGEFIHYRKERFNESWVSSQDNKVLVRLS